MLKQFLVDLYVPTDLADGGVSSIPVYMYSTKNIKDKFSLSIFTNNIVSYDHTITCNEH